MDLSINANSCQEKRVINEHGDVRSNICEHMTKETRHQTIIQLIESSSDDRPLRTRELAEQLGVSEMTVRRDLRELSMGGFLSRLHGGAFPMRPQTDQLRKEIGVLLVSKTGKYTDPFFNAILEGADSKLQELGYRMTFINSRAEVNTAAQARDLLQPDPVDGIILVGFVGPESVDYLRKQVRALIQTTDSIAPDLDTVTFDGYNGIRRMVDHLVNCGYRRLGFITGGTDFRQQAFIDGIKAHRLPEDPGLSVVLPYGLDGWTPEIGQIGAQQLMTLSNPPDAIVCASDRIAIGTIQWLHQHKYNVPSDVAVTGFDNLTESAFTIPSLTTVHVHKQLIGALAAERAVRCIENEDEIPLFILTPTKLVIRQSCGSET
jgi:DNA-binding LacI/PurR family transcriptional regulator